MDISLMTTQKPPATGTSEEKLAAPDKAAFEEQLQEKMAPPGDAAPPPPDGVEGAMRTEADAQPIADDQTLDQPQDTSLLEALTTVTLWQAVVPAQIIDQTSAPEASAEATPAMTVAADAAANTGSVEAVTTEGEEGADSEIESTLTDLVKGVVKDKPQGSPETGTKIEHAAPEAAAETAVQNAAVAEKIASALKEEATESDEKADVKVETVEVEAIRPNDTPKPAQEQIQIKPHSLDRPARALEAVQEAREPINTESHVRSAHVKMSLVSETFGNLNVSIKAFGQSVEADVQTQSPDLNRALNTHRTDLVQSVESKGLTLSQFDVRQQGQQPTPDQGQGQPQDQPATKEDLERLANLSIALGETTSTPKPLAGLVNTLA